MKKHPSHCGLRCKPEKSSGKTSEFFSFFAQRLASAFTKSKVGKQRMRLLSVSLAALFMLALFAPSSVQAAATRVWNNVGGGEWNTTTSWTAPVVPIAGDTAIFNIALSGAVTNSGDQPLTNIIFDTNANSITIGTTNGGRLLLGTAGSVTLTGSLAGTNTTEMINAPILLGSGSTAVTYSFINNNTTASNILVFGGGISAGTTGTTTLTLTGVNSGSNVITGNITNGSASSFGITKTGATGLWILAGNNTYSGTTTVTSGTLKAGSTTAFSSNSIVTGSTGGVLDLGGYNNSIGSLASTGGLIVNLGAATLTMGADNTSPAAFVGQIVGTGAVTKVGTGTITLNGTSSFISGMSNFSGGLNIQQGVIKTAAGTSAAVGNGSLGSGVVSFGSATTSGTLDLSASIAMVAGISTAGSGTASSQLIGNSGAAASTLYLTGGGSYTYGGVIANIIGAGTSTMALVKNGTGTQTLTGTNTFSGNTTVNAGTLALSASGQFVSGTILINNGGTFTTGTTSTIGGSAAIVVTGGSATLSGTNTRTGATTVNGGTLTLDYGTTNTAKLASGAVLTLAGGATIALTGGTTTDVASSTTLNAGGTQITRTSGTARLNMAAITRNVGSTLSIGTPGMVLTTTVNNSSGILGGWAVVGSAGSADWATMTSSSITALSSYTSFATAGGANTINYTLIGSSALTSALTAATVKINSSGTSQALNLGNASLTVNSSAGGLMYVGANDYSINGSTGTLASSLTDLIIQQWGLGTLTINARIIDGGAGSTLTKAGSGTLVLGASNTYTGNTYLNQGTLKPGVSLGSFGSASGSNTVILSSGATLDLNGINLTLNALANAPGGIGTVALGGNTLTLLGNAQTFNGVISGTGGVTKNGTGIQTFTGLSTYTGATTLNSGTVSVPSLSNGGVAGPLGQSTNAAGNLVFGGGTLQYTGTGNSTDHLFTIGDANGNSATLDASGSGAMNFLNTGAILIGGTTGIHTLTLQGSWVQAGSGNPYTVVGSDLSSNILASAITDQVGGGATSVVKSGTGYWILTGTSNYSGGTTINAGRIIALGATSLGSGSVTVTAGAQVIFTGSNVTYANNLVLSGSGFSAKDSGATGVSAGATVLNNGATLSGTITLNGLTVISASPLYTAPGSTYTNNGTISGQITGSGTLGMISAGVTGGVLTISNPLNNYTGDTLITGGNTSPGLYSQMVLGANEVIPNGPGKGNLWIYGPAGAGQGILDLNGYNETVNGLSGTLGLASNIGGMITNSSVLSSTSTLTVGDNNASGTYYGLFQNSTLYPYAPVATGTLGVLALTKVGTGTETIAGFNISTNTGATTINGGTLKVDMTQATTSGTYTAAGLLSGSSTLVLGGGTFSLNGRLNGTAGLIVASGTTNASNSLSPASITFPGGTDMTKFAIGQAVYITSGTFLQVVSTATAGTSLTIYKISGNTLQFNSATSFASGATPVTIYTPAANFAAYTTGSTFALTNGPSVITGVSLADAAMMEVGQPIYSGTYFSTNSMITGISLSSSDATITISGTTRTTGTNFAAITVGAVNNTFLTSQTVNGIVVNQGASAMVINNNGGDGTALSFGLMTRNMGSTLNLTLPSGTQSVTNGFVGIAPTTSGGVITNANGTAYATVGGSDWASFKGGAIVSHSVYSPPVVNGFSYDETDVDGTAYPYYSESGLATPYSFTVNTLRFNIDGTTLDLDPASPSIIGAGGILVTPAASTQGVTISCVAGTGVSLIPGTGMELVIINNGKLTVSASIGDSKSGPSALTLSGTGSMTLSGTNTYTGPTYVNSGTVTLGSTQALGTGTTALTMGSPAFLNLAGNDTSVGSLAGSGTIALGAGTLTVGGLGTSTTYTGQISGPGNLATSGSGTLTLSGSLAYTGATTVGGGTMIVSGSLAGTSSVLVNSGAKLIANGGIKPNASLTVHGTLSGSGSLGNVTISNDGTIDPGNGDIATLNVVNMTLQGTALMQLDKNGTVLTADQIKVNGNAINFGGTLTVTLTLENGAVPQIGDTFKLFQGTAYNNSFTALNLQDLSVYGLSWDTSQLKLNGSLVVATLPEPTTWALVVGGMGMLTFGQRLRRRRQ